MQPRSWITKSANQIKMTTSQRLSVLGQILGPKHIDVLLEIGQVYGKGAHFAVKLASEHGNWDFRNARHGDLALTPDGNGVVREVQKCASTGRPLIILLPRDDTERRESRAELVLRVMLTEPARGWTAGDVVRVTGGINRNTHSSMLALAKNGSVEKAERGYRVAPPPPDYLSIALSVHCE